MSVIHGDITKIYELEKDAYTQQLTGGAFIDAYSFGAVIIALSTAYFEITSATFPREGSLLHSINVSTSSVTGTPQRIYLIKYPEATTLGDFYFRYDTTKQFFLGDASAYLPAGETIRLYMENNDGANIVFEGTLWWLNPPGT